MKAEMLRDFKKNLSENRFYNLNIFQYNDHPDKLEFARFYERCKDAPNWLSGACSRTSRTDIFVCRLIVRQRDMSMKRSGMRMQSPLNKLEFMCPSLHKAYSKSLSQSNYLQGQQYNRCAVPKAQVQASIPG